MTIKSFFQSTLKTALAIATALVITIGVVTAGYIYFEKREESQKALEALPYEIVKHWSIDLTKPLQLDFSVDTKLIEGTMYVSIRANGAPDYLNHPHNKTNGAFFLSFIDKDGFELYKKAIPTYSFSGIVGDTKNIGISYQYNEYVSLEKYKIFNGISIEWNVDTKLATQKSPPSEIKKPTKPIASENNNDPCAPGLTKEERLRRLSSFGNIRQTGSDTYAAGDHRVIYIGGQLFSCE